MTTPNVAFVDETNVRLNDADPEGTTRPDRPSPNARKILMNARFLFATTLGLAVASSWALADEAPVSRAAVAAEAQQATHAGTLHRTDYDDELAARPTTGSTVSRSAVIAAMNTPRDPRIVGPLRSRTYNPFGTETLRYPMYSRSEVKAAVLEARAEHTLRPAGEAGDLDVAAAPRREAPAILVGRLHRTGS